LAHLASSTRRDLRLILPRSPVIIALKTVQERVYRNCSCSFFSLQLSKSSVNPPVHLTLAEILFLYKSDCLVHWICPWVQILELYTSWVQIPPAQLKAPIFYPIPGAPISVHLFTVSVFCLQHTYCFDLKTNLTNFNSYKLDMFEHQKNLSYMVIKFVSTFEQLKLDNIFNWV
jgi:hypothetical protein